jgi:hypothetical protein
MFSAISFIPPTGTSCATHSLLSALKVKQISSGSFLCSSDIFVAAAAPAPAPAKAKLSPKVKGAKPIPTAVARAVSPAPIPSAASHPCFIMQGSFSKPETLTVCSLEYDSTFLVAFLFSYLALSDCVVNQLSVALFLKWFLKLFSSKMYAILFLLLLISYVFCYYLAK